MRSIVPFAVFGLTAFAWGLMVGTYEVFPHRQIRAVKNAIDGNDGSRDPALYIGNPVAVEAGAGDPQWNTRADNVLIGDSLVAQARVEEMFPGTSVANRGVGGDTIQGVLERLPGILELEPKRALIFVGHNDVLFDNPNPAITARFARAVETLQRSGVRPVLLSVLVCGDNPVCTQTRRRNAADLNARLRTLAAAKHISFIDLNAAMAGPDGLKKEMTWDGIHLNGAGNRILRDVVAPHLLVRPQADRGFKP